MKLASENQSYNPYGRAGAGAPLRDKNGNIIADLRGTNRTDNNADNTQQIDMLKENRKPYPIEKMNLSVSSTANDPAFGTNLPTNRANNPVEPANSFARGGNGIFGEAKVSRLSRLV
jgi:centrosome and spindle pole-associated protein 1